jgi:hypothetical protein
MWFFKLLAFLGIVKLVWLTDWQGGVCLSIKRKDIHGFWCWVYPTFAVGNVRLRPDGKCYGESCYIKTWVDY